MGINICIDININLFINIIINIHFQCSNYLTIIYLEALQLTKYFCINCMIYFDSLLQLLKMALYVPPKKEESFFS